MAANLDQIGARLRFYMKMKGLGIYELGLITNTSAILVSNIIAGKNYTMDDLLLVLSQIKDLNSHWVIYGEGNIFKDNESNGPIPLDKRLQHLQQMQELLEKLDAIEKSKANRNQIEELKARIAALTTQL